jgi:hypothetical protein
MDSRTVSLKLSPLLALAALAAPFVQAQPATTNAWKPIIFSSFSSPDNSGISSNLTSPSTQPVPPANLQGVFQNTTPVPSFSFGPAPMPDTGRRLQRKSDDRADWVFQTPAEIMGVAPDQILPDGKRNKDGQQNTLTPLERYLEGRSPVSKSKMNSSPSRNFWGDENAQTNSDGDSPDLMNTGLDDLQSSDTPGQPLNSVPNTVLGNNLFASPNQEPVWPNVLGAPAPQPTANPVNSLQQQADMNQFQRMLNPSFVPVTAAATVPDSATSFKSQINLPASDSTQPLVNPIGASFTPLNSGIGQATPLVQLPGITRQANTQSPLTPSWAPQPAPWLSPNPQPFAIPQRKF